MYEYKCYIYTIQEPTNRVFLLSSLNHELENSMAINSSEDQFSYYKSSQNILASNDKFRTLNTTQITFLCKWGRKHIQLYASMGHSPHSGTFPAKVHCTAATIMVDAALKRNTVPGSTILNDQGWINGMPGTLQGTYPYPTQTGSSENHHLQKCVGKGNVSSQEGMQFSSILSFGGISFQTSMLRALFSLRAAVKSNMRRCHLPRCPTRMLGPSFYSNQYINLMVSRLLHHPTTNETGSVKYLSLPFWSQHMTAFKPVKFYHLLRLFHV